MSPLPPINKLLAQAHDFFNDTPDDGSAASDLNPEIQSKMKILLQSALQKMDVVSREEFDAQTAVLQRTRLRLESLEAEVIELTAALEDDNR
ncbi:MAG: accessory factor UbiK family protein [Cellvibrionaceae bacterium]